MYKTKSKKIFLVLLVASLLIFSVAFTGCTEDGGENETDETDDGSDGGDGSEWTGTSTYSGTWEGTVGGEQYSGTLQLEADFDEGNIIGNFSGDGEGDIQGTISGGTIDADGTAGFGTVVWSGDFSSDGASIDGNWELEQGAQYGSGTWQATEN